MAEELGRFVPLVGGPEYAHFLLLPLETLACGAAAGRAAEGRGRAGRSHNAVNGNLRCRLLLMMIPEA